MSARGFCLAMGLLVINTITLAQAPSTATELTLEQLHAQSAALDQELASDRARLAAAELAIQAQRTQLAKSALATMANAEPVMPGITTWRWVQLLSAYLGLLIFAAWLWPRLRS